MSTKQLLDLCNEQTVPIVALRAVVNKIKDELPPNRRPNYALDRARFKWVAPNYKEPSNNVRKLCSDDEENTEKDYEEGLIMNRIQHEDWDREIEELEQEERMVDTFLEKVPEHIREEISVIMRDTNPI